MATARKPKKAKVRTRAPRAMSGDPAAVPIVAPPVDRSEPLEYRDKCSSLRFSERDLNRVREAAKRCGFHHYTEWMRIAILNAVSVSETAERKAG